MDKKIEKFIELKGRNSASLEIRKEMILRDLNQAKDRYKTKSEFILFSIGYLGREVSNVYDELIQCYDLLFDAIININKQDINIQHIKNKVKPFEDLEDFEDFLEKKIKQFENKRREKVEKDNLQGYI